MNLDDTRHIVITSYIGWGHLRGLCILSARLVKLRQSTTVTFLTARSSYDRVQAEVSRDFDEREQHLRDRVKIVALEENQENMFDVQTFDTAFVNQYRKLVNGDGSVQCAKTGASIPVGSGRIPDAVILDVFAYDACMAVRKAHPGVKIYCWAPAPTSGAIPLMGSLGPDTKGLLHRRVQERMSSTGESFEDAAHNTVAFGLSEDIISVPGLPAMYNYEAAPQMMPNDDFKQTAVIHIAAADFYHEADGIITPTLAAFDPPESTEATRKFLALTGRKLYVVGPLLPSSVNENATKNELSQSPKAQEIEVFMERILRTNGEKSLIYISFGSMFWSAEPEKIWAFVDTLLEKKIPFIMARASPFAHVPIEIDRKVEATGLGLLTSWAPQQLILNSPVTGWFVSHCGVNSIIETVMAGVPMIAWPFGAEQPFNAVHCADTLDIAYELFEVRTKNALKVYRTGITHTGTVEAVRDEAAAVLERAFGPDGEVKRKNILRLREAAAQAWTDGGSAKLAVQNLLEEL